MLLTPAQIKPKSFESKWNFFFFFYPGWMYLMFWAQCCFHSLIHTQIFWRMLIVLVDSCAER